MTAGPKKAGPPILRPIRPIRIPLSPWRFLAPNPNLNPDLIQSNARRILAKHRRQ
jgi:hypothetical protein